MLSVEKTSDKVWRKLLWKLLPGGHDAGNELAIQVLFEDGMRWANQNHVPHKRTDSSHYAEQYLRTLENEDPVIPKHMRRYIAFKLGYDCMEDTKQPVKPPTQPLRPSHRLKKGYGRSRQLPTQHITVRA